MVIMILNILKLQQGLLKAQRNFPDNFSHPSFGFTPTPKHLTQMYLGTNLAIRSYEGGVSSNYSEYVHLICDNTKAPVKYLFSKILILTNGLCGSTCAVTSSHLNQVDRVKTVTFGGFYNQSQQYFSFPGKYLPSFTF